MKSRFSFQACSLRFWTTIGLSQFKTLQSNPFERQPLSLQPQKSTKATSGLYGQRLLIPSLSLFSILHSESEKEKLLFLLGGAPAEGRASGRDKRKVWGENEEVVERAKMALRCFQFGRSPRYFSLAVKAFCSKVSALL